MRQFVSLSEEGQSSSVWLRKKFLCTLPEQRNIVCNVGVLNMKFVLIIVAIMSLGGLTGCQPDTGRNVVTSDMGEGGGGSGGGY